jgi:hypothetical protein
MVNSPSHGILSLLSTSEKDIITKGNDASDGTSSEIVFNIKLHHPKD